MMMMKLIRTKRCTLKFLKLHFVMGRNQIFLLELNLHSQVISYLLANSYLTALSIVTPFVPLYIDQSLD